MNYKRSKLFTFIFFLLFIIITLLWNYFIVSALNMSRFKKEPTIIEYLYYWSKNVIEMTEKEIKKDFYFSKRKIKEILNNYK